MQPTVALVQQPGLQSSKLRPSVGAHQSLSYRPTRLTAHRTALAPQAFVRGTCGMPFGAGRASQQVLEQMLQEIASVSPSSRRSTELPLAVDAADEGEAYVFSADIPGVQRQDLKVSPIVMAYRISLSWTAAVVTCTLPWVVRLQIREPRMCKQRAYTVYSVSPV